MVLSMPYLVYIREARDDEMHLDGQLLFESECDSKQATDEKRFVIFAADGECLAVVPNKSTAVAWARENNLKPQSVH